jgi:hypothetical protein
MLSLSRWKPGQLLLSWGAYWAGLVAVKLGPAILEMWRVTRLPEGHGVINATFGNDGFNLSVVEDGVTTLATSASLSSILLWVLVPPIVLWALWLLARVRQPAPVPSVSAREQAALSEGTGPAREWRPQEDRMPAERIHTPNP